MKDLVLWPGIEFRPPALGAQDLSHWTTREVLPLSSFTPKISVLKHCTLWPLPPIFLASSRSHPCRNLRCTDTTFSMCLCHLVSSPLPPATLITQFSLQVSHQDNHFLELSTLVKLQSRLFPTFSYLCSCTWTDCWKFMIMLKSLTFNVWPHISTSLLTIPSMRNVLPPEREWLTPLFTLRPCSNLISLTFFLIKKISFGCVGATLWHMGFL